MSTRAQREAADWRERKLLRAEAAIKSAYGYCEGAGGHYKDALEAVMATLADYLWPEPPVKQAKENL